MTENELIFHFCLARTETIGPITYRRLIAKYKTAEAALNAIPFFTKGKPISIFSRDKAMAEIENIHKLKGKIISLYDDDYPAWLKEIEDAPPILSVIGNVSLFTKPSIGIVGSRNSSLNARKFCYALSRDLGEQKFVIASGLARGIDTSAHEGSLATGTIAVIAGGVDVIYPPENKKLYEQICETGAVVSEAPLGMQPLAQHFPKRNRIITGLSQGVVVIEANAKSGSLISARMAAEQGRAVMAVPSFPSDPRSTGTNDLIRNGAILVRSFEDVIEEIQNFTHSSESTHRPYEQYDKLLDGANDDFFHEPPLNSSKIQEILLSNISIAPTSVDEILRACHLNSQEANAILFELELSGVVQRLPGNRICRIA
jgi:DNA processing protein